MLPADQGLQQVPRVLGVLQVLLLQLLQETLNFRLLHYFQVPPKPPGSQGPRRPQVVQVTLRYHLSLEPQVVHSPLAARGLLVSLGFLHYQLVLYLPWDQQVLQNQADRQDQLVPQPLLPQLGLCPRVDHQSLHFLVPLGYLVVLVDQDHLQDHLVLGLL